METRRHPDGTYAPGNETGIVGGLETRFGAPGGPDPSECGKKGSRISPTAALARKLDLVAAEKIAVGLIQAAADGNVSAYKEIADRIDGPVALAMGEVLKSLQPQVVVVRGEYEAPELPREVESEPSPRGELGPVDAVECDPGSGSSMGGLSSLCKGPRIDDDPK